MIVLALDTALSACSAAVGGENGVRASRYVECLRGHAEILMPMIEAVLAEARLEPGAVERIGVTIGPGSFTGVRTGISAARGLGLALKRPVLGITTTAAVAAAVSEKGPLAVAFDARRAELYLGAFDETRTEIMPPCAMGLDKAATALLALRSSWLVAGSAAEALAQSLRRAGGGATIAADAVWPRATALVSLLLDAQFVPRLPRPLYLRPADAQPLFKSVP